MRRLLVLAALLAGPGALAQPAVSTEPLKLSGPRIGITYVTGDLADDLDRELDAAPVLTQFGWQFETRIFTADTGLSAVTELVPLVGGLEQGLFLPSMSFLVGLRGPTGFEFGLGPNVSLAGAGLVLATGLNREYGGVNFPVNVSAVLGGEGVRVSLLVGFNLAR